MTAHAAPVFIVHVARCACRLVDVEQHDLTVVDHVVELAVIEPQPVAPFHHFGRGLDRFGFRVALRLYHRVPGAHARARRAVAEELVHARVKHPVFDLGAELLDDHVRIREPFRRHFGEGIEHAVITRSQKRRRAVEQPVAQLAHASQWMPEMLELGQLQVALRYAGIIEVGLEDHRTVPAVSRTNDVPAEGGLADVTNLAVEDDGIPFRELQVIRRNNREVDVHQDEVGGHKASSAIDVLDRMSVFAPEVGQMVDDIFCRVTMPVAPVEQHGDSPGSGGGAHYTPYGFGLAKAVSYNMNGARVIQWVTQSDNPLPPGA